MRVAMTRAVSPSIDQCLLTHMERARIDVSRACSQHHAYRELLSELVDEYVQLDALDEYPDSCFVEDNAFVVDEVCILANMQSAQRRGEVAHLASHLEVFRPVERIVPPGTLEGGDVFRVGKTVFVGLSSRTNVQGAKQLASVLEPLGYTVRFVPVRACLHLTTGASHIGGNRVLCNPLWVDADVFAQAREENITVLNVHPQEPWAGNTLLVGDTLVMHAGFPKTQELAMRFTPDLRTVDISELMKAEAGLTCMSLIFEKEPSPITPMKSIPGAQTTTAFD